MMIKKIILKVTKDSYREEIVFEDGSSVSRESHRESRGVMSGPQWPTWLEEKHEEVMDEVASGCPFSMAQALLKQAESEGGGVTKKEFVNELELGLSHEDFCKELDMQLLNGMGEGCSYANALSWTKECWAYKEREIKKLVEALEFYSTYTSGELDPNGEYTRVDIGMEARQALEAYKR